MSTLAPHRTPAPPMTNDHYTPEPDAIVAHPLRTYLALARHYPLLTAEQERHLAERIAAGRASPRRRADAEEARQQLVQANLRLVVRLAHRYAPPDLIERGFFDMLDLIQEGNIGLIRAAETFDPSRGVRFSTHAGWVIRHHITRAIADRSRLIRLPVHTQTVLRAAYRAADQLRQTLGREPTVEEIAVVIGCTVAHLRLALSALSGMASLDEPLDADDDGHTLETMIPDEQATAPEQMAERCSLWEVLGQVLDERERRVLALHYGLNGNTPRPYEEIGRAWGMTKQAIHLIERQALGKLRAVASDLDLGAFLDLPPGAAPATVQRAKRSVPAGRRRATATATVPAAA